MGRPKKEIDYELVKNLSNILCTQEEIANILNVSVRTLQRDEEFCRIYKKGQDTGKMTLRRYQFKLAEKNPTMAIFLGKNILGQKDKVEYTDDGMKAINENISNIADLINNPRENRTEDDFDEV